MTALLAGPSRLLLGKEDRIIVGKFFRVPQLGQQRFPQKSRLDKLDPTSANSVKKPISRLVGL